MRTGKKILLRAFHDTEGAGKMCTAPFVEHVRINAIIQRDARY
ncbi:hypothetical protein ACFS07_36535 [Undibacterium arcticum]